MKFNHKLVRIPLIIALIALTCFFKADNRLIQWAGLHRSQQWETLKQFFESSKPSSLLEYFGYARALEKSGAPFERVTSAYTGCLGQARAFSKASQAAAALKSPQISSEAQTSLAGGLCILHLGRYLKAEGHLTAASAVWSGRNFKAGQPVDREIASEYLSLEISNFASPSRAAGWQKAFEPFGNSPLFTLRRAQAHRIRGNHKEAVSAYLDVLSRSAAWLRRSAANDLHKHYPGSAGSAVSKMNMAVYAPYSARKAYKVDSSLAVNCPKTALQVCGQYLADQRDYGSLRSLLNNNLARVRAEPSIADSWLDRLSVYKHKTGMKIVFSRLGINAIRKHNGLWYTYLTYLKSAAGPYTKTYFSELLYYSRKNPSYSRYDSIMGFLLQYKKKSNRPVYAPARFFKLALETLPDDNLKGRLLYWNWRRLKSAGQAGERDALRVRHLSPDSYYAQWIPADDADYRQAWQQVKDSSSYLDWLGRFGNRPEALKWLGNRSFTRYQDPAARALWNELKNVPPESYLPKNTLLLYRLGLYTLGSKYYSVESNQPAGSTAYHREKYYLGVKAGSLYIVQWHLRMLLKKKGINFDPARMPAPLARSLYPRPYLPTVKRVSREFSTFPHAVYALMRQESAFREAAISRSNAKGLMQVLPSTGEWLARGLKYPRPYDLLHPVTSITFGTKFISDLLRSQPDFGWMAVAYNGGPGNLRKWKKRYYADDFLFFLEKLPRSEPRHYAMITRRNLYNYEVIYSLHN